jgi:hypothetical protein
MIDFLDEMQNLAKSTHFEIFIFIQHWLIQNMWSIEETIFISNNKLQKIYSKKISYRKNEKGLQITQSPFIK